MIVNFHTDIMSKKRSYFLNILLILSLFIFVNTENENVDVIMPSNIGYYCYVRCLAKCLDEHEISSLENGLCPTQCQRYNNDHLCKNDDSTCWTSCDGLVRETGPMPQTPENVTVTYTTVPERTPYEADLKWNKVQSASFYIVQYVDTTQKWTTNSSNLTITNDWHFVKPELCPSYAFRVTAANKFGVSSFSESAILAAPIPVVENPSYDVVSRELLDEPFLGYSPDDPKFNTTVRIVVNYTAPTGWNMNDIVHVEPVFHVVEMALPGQPVAPEVTPIRGKSEFEILLPGDIAYTSSRSSFFFEISRMYTKCNPRRAVEYPHTANRVSPIFISCNDFEEVVCPGKPINPSCNLINSSTPTFECANGTINNTVMVFTQPTTNMTIQYYIIKYAEIKRTLGSPLVPVTSPFINETTIRISSNATSFAMPDVSVNHYYETSICAIFDNSTEKNIRWNITSRFPVDLTGEKAYVCVAKSTPNQRKNIIWIIPLALILLLGCIVITCLYARMRRRHTKTLSELASLNKGVNLDGLDNGYVDMPRLYDRWEIPKSHLLIYEDKKLGSGAFGAVYKGKIRGRALMNKCSQSTMAEQWMKVEDCEVAVKMLPEYADDGAKSEFRKEINLMKQLGYNERLVNMLCCISADEPLCLVVEYCTDGDLLHYLRDRCKYMVKLQERGIDLCNLMEDTEVDLNYILTMKDLLAFSWQISVGMEYLSERNYIHRDVAARNIMVDTGKRAKIGDFGLCRYSCSDPIYTGKGGRLPWKWMALEAIKSYEFTSKSDVWSFGVLLFEIVTLGGSPYPGIDPGTMEKYLDDGNRLAQPDNCPDEIYSIMTECWSAEPEKRPTFNQLRERLSKQLEHITEDYSYLNLNQSRDYYNMDTSRQQYPNTLDSVMENDDFDEPPNSETLFGTGTASTSFINDQLLTPLNGHIPSTPNMGSQIQYADRLNSSPESILPPVLEKDNALLIPIPEALLPSSIGVPVLAGNQITATAT